MNLPDWELLRVDGAALIYGWKEGKEADRLAKERFDADRLAFGPVGEGEASPLPPAPGSGPGRAPRPPRPWEHRGRPAPLPAWESAAANVFLRRYGEGAPAQLEGIRVRGSSAYAAALVGLLTQQARPLAGWTGVGLAHGLSSVFVASMAERPPELPLLTVRAARRALASNPEDTNAYLRLAEAYRILRDETCERSREGRLPALSMLRHVQIVTALEHALALDPDREVVRQNLADLYLERNYLDSALEHRRAQLALLRRAKLRPGESAEEHTHRVSQLEDQVLELDNLVGEQKNRYVVAVQSLQDNPLRRAQVALGLGLARMALDDVLLKSRVLLFGTGGAQLELELLLMMGRAEEARTMLQDDEMKKARETLGIYDLPGFDPSGQPTLFRLPAYSWLLCCQAAALGDYDRVAAELEDIRTGMQTEALSNLQDIRNRLPFALGIEVGNRVHPLTNLGEPILRDHSQWGWRPSAAALPEWFRLQAEAADVEILAGLVALERGLPSEARRHLQEALRMCPPGSSSDQYFTGRTIAQAYLKRLPAPRAGGR